MATAWAEPYTCAMSWRILSEEEAAALPEARLGGALLWIVGRAGIVISGGALSHWPLLVDLAAEASLAAGFCGYMAGAVRPNAYYRRRLPTA